MAAIATLKPDLGTVEVWATLYFYGAEATPELGQAIIDEINNQYNDVKAEVWVQNRFYKVEFNIDYQIINDIDTLVKLVSGNTDFRKNFIRIEAKNNLTRSFMGFGLGDNVGHWITSDGLGHSTTAPHEFGHGLGLDHPEEIDFRGLEISPPIMAPRGTIVDANFQWNPTALVGEFGGTMNPKHRKVSVAEIKQVFELIDFNENGVALIGRLSNILFDEVGNSIGWV